MTLTQIKQQLSDNHISIVQVVAIDNQHAIGKNNQLAWHIPEDLAHFRTVTSGGVVLMGRKTFESIGKPLPNRVNWVITRDKAWTADGVKVAHSLENALLSAMNDVKNSTKNDKVFIIGGGEIFAQSLDVADILEISHIGLDIDGDAFYPPIPSDFVKIASRAIVSEKTGTAVTFATYQKP